MHRHYFYRVTLAAVVLASAVIAFAAAQPIAPSPKPSAPPKKAFTYSGFARAYYFARQNASALPAGGGQLNQTAFNTALKLHAEYAFLGTPWHIGATYIGADPFGANGACDQIPQYSPGGGCQEYPKSIAAYKETDATLPTFGLSTLSEAWVQYQTSALNVKAGDQLFTSPWANPSDTRVKPAFYQGVDLHDAFAPGWSVEVARITQWESRSASDFNQSTLITLNSDGTFKPTPGFLLGALAYTNGGLTTDANFYDFYNIASLWWLEEKWYVLPNSPFRPFLAAHYGSEENAGTSLVGVIDATLEGLQLGASFGKNVDFSAGYDHVPVRSSFITLPAGVKCNAKTHLIGGNSGYFLPTSGTPNCVPGAVKGTATIYYGGIASPYTDGYTSDPSFTTSISQGLMERQSPASAIKLVATIQSNNRQWRAILSRAYYNYGNPAGIQNTLETDIDGTYFFSHVYGPIYHGFLLRDRYMARVQTNTAVFGGLPLFKANRVQLEYDF